MPDGKGVFNPKFADICVSKCNTHSITRENNLSLLSALVMLFGIASVSYICLLL